MTTLKIANIFSVRKGYIYRYLGETTGKNVTSVVTEKLSILLKANDFISSVVEFEGKIFVYISEIFPEGTLTTDFLYVGNVEESITEYIEQQAAYLKSVVSEAESKLDQSIDLQSEPSQSDDLIPESGDSQNAS